MPGAKVLSMNAEEWKVNWQDYFWTDVVKKFFKKI
jgi:hypothetical protein